MSSAVGMVGAQEQQQVESSTNANATVAFSDQTSDGTSVTVDSVNMSEGGFVVIHDDSLLDGNVAGSVIGVSEYLEPGETENVTVTLYEGVPGASFNETELTGNQTLIAMPHKDTNASGTYDFVATGGTEDGPYSDNGSAVTDSANVTVETPTPPTTGESFDVTDLSAPEVIERNNTLNVSATVENPNDVADTQTVEYRFDGTVMVREQISLDAGESTTLNATVNTSTVASDVYIHGVYTRERGRATQVRIADEIVSFDVTDLTAPESVTAGDNVTVNATVSNPNDFAIEQEVEFRFDGDLVETRTVDLDGENSTTVQFRIGTEGVPPGSYIHSVFSQDFGQSAVITVDAPDGDAGDGNETETPAGNETETDQPTDTATETETGNDTETAAPTETGTDTETATETETATQTEGGNSTETDSGGDQSTTSEGG